MCLLILMCVGWTGATAQGHDMNDANIQVNHRDAGGSCGTIIRKSNLEPQTSSFSSSRDIAANPPSCLHVLPAAPATPSRTQEAPATTRGIRSTVSPTGGRISGPFCQHRVCWAPTTPARGKLQPHCQEPVPPYCRPPTPATILSCCASPFGSAQASYIRPKSARSTRTRNSSRFCATITRNTGGLGHGIVFEKCGQ